MRDPVATAIALGSNLGDRSANLGAGLAGIAALPGTRLTACSRVVETGAVGPVVQGPFLNAAALVETRLDPRALLGALQEIERANGRRREHEARFGPRTLDLDLLLYGDLVIDEPGLRVPHPRMSEREFVLGPLAQIGGGLRVPGRAGTVADLLGVLRAAPLRVRSDA